jgi:hypothetical protein
MCPFFIRFILLVFNFWGLCIFWILTPFQIDTQGSSGGEGPCSALRWKSKVRKVLFVERRKERLHGLTGGIRNQWSPGSDWKLDFIDFILPKGGDFGRRNVEGEVSP